MASDSSLDPYRPPPTDLPYLAPGRPTRPAWFVIVCVIAIALGGMGFFHAVYAVTSLTFGDPAEWILPSPGAGELPAGLDDVQKEFEDGVRAVQERYLPALLPLALARLALTSCLVLGGIWCLGGKPAGRKLLAGTFTAALVFEVCDSVIQGFIAPEMVAPFRTFGQALDEQRPAQQGVAPVNLGEMVFVAVLWGVMCVYYVCQAAKVIYYLGGLLYLRRSSLDPLFALPEEPAQASAA